MPFVNIELDENSYEELKRISESEERSIRAQATRMLRTAIHATGPVFSAPAPVLVAPVEPAKVPAPPPEPRPRPPQESKGWSQETLRRINAYKAFRGPKHLHTVQLSLASEVERLEDLNKEMEGGRRYKKSQLGEWVVYFQNEPYFDELPD